MKKTFLIITILFLATSCEFFKKSNETKTEEAKVESVKAKEPECECSESQAQNAAYDIIRQYEKTQRYVNSDLARCFKQDELRKISNCNYILTIIQKNCWNDYENIRITKKLECIGNGEFYVN